MATASTTTVTAAAATTTVPVPTTIPGPVPRASRRVASPVAIEKIRATSLPLRTMGIVLAAVVAALAASGFVYGKIRSRIPPVAIPQVAVPGGRDITGPLPAPSPATMRPPPAIPLPPPIIEDAMSDTVIFEPPPEHLAPPVIAETPETPESPEPPGEPDPDDPDT